MTTDRARLGVILAAAAAGIAIAIGFGCGVAAANPDSSSSTGTTSSDGGKSPAKPSSPSASPSESGTPANPVNGQKSLRPKSRPSSTPTNPAHDQASLGEVDTTLTVPTKKQKLSDALPNTKAKTTGEKPTAATKLSVDTPTFISKASLPHSIAAPDAAPAATQSPLDFIGGLVFNTLTALTNLVVGPPSPPPGSTVTIAHSTLQIGDVAVPADWYFPEGTDPSGVIYFQHGSMATPAMYSHTAAELAQETNSIVVMPQVSSTNFGTNGDWLGGAKMQEAAAALFSGDRTELTESASLAAGHEMTLPDSFVLVGHSLGGGFVTAMAGYLDAESRKNLKGVVLFDPVTTSTDAMSTALGQLPGVPVMVIASPPYYWNQLNAAANVVAAARPGEFVGVVLNNGSHSDYVQGSNPLFELGLYAVTGFSQPQNVDAVQVLAGGWITDMLNNTHTGVYGVAGQPISIPTGAGVATGIALPDNVHQPSVVDVLLVAVVNFLTAPLSAA